MWEMGCSSMALFTRRGQSWKIPYPLGSSDLIKTYNCLPYLNEYIIWEPVMGLDVLSIAIQFSIAIEFSFAMEFSCWRVIIMFNKYIPFRDLIWKTQHPFSLPTKLSSSQDHWVVCRSKGTFSSQAHLSAKLVLREPQSQRPGETMTSGPPGRTGPHPYIAAKAPAVHQAFPMNSKRVCKNTPWCPANHFIFLPQVPGSLLFPQHQYRRLWESRQRWDSPENTDQRHSVALQEYVIDQK
jgi:hypothetical protein